MATREQLEIIGPAGEVVFYNLNPAKGTTNIGRHPDNDIVLHGTGIAHFHAIIDHRQLPYQVLVLSEEGKTSLEGTPLAPNSFTPIELWYTIQLDGYTIMLVENNEEAAGLVQQPVLPPPTTTAIQTQAKTPGGTYTLATVAETQLPEELPDIPAPPPSAFPFENNIDPSIPIQLSAREWVIDVLQTASCEVTLTNGGERVAAFEIQVQGIPARWVNIAYPKGKNNESKQQVELAEGEKATITLSITPPRIPSSRAGTHYLGIVVTSPTYGRSSQAAATLIINPYYEFAVGELAHKQMTLRWPNRSVHTELAIANLSNAPAFFHIEAADDEKACDFEFKVPNKEGSFVNQAEYSLQSQEAYNVPVQITPHKSPRWMGKSRNYSFTANVNMREGQQVPYSRRGQISSHPAIGPLVYMSLAAFLLFLIVAILIWTFRPAIDAFNSIPAAPTAGEPIIIRAGEPITLSWKASSFANLTLSTIYDSLDQTPEEVILDDPEGSKPLFPPNNVATYRLTGENILSKIIPLPFLKSEKSLAIKVERILPEITSFTANPPNFIYNEQEKVTLNWTLKDADKLTLYINPPIEGLGDVIEMSAQPTGTYEIHPTHTTNFRLEARHEESDLSAEKSFEVRVHPNIRSFTVNTTTIPFWGKVTLNWAVSGADKVIIDKIGEVESYGVQPHNPGEEGLYTYRLIAYNGNIEESKTVTVSVGQPPQSPQINKFEFEKPEVVFGDVKTVNLSWDISGDIERIEITGPGFEYTTTDEKEKLQGALIIPVDETKNYLLKAIGQGDPQPVVSKMAALNVLLPTPTATPTLTPTPTPTHTPVPPTPTPPPPPEVVWYAAAIAEESRLYVHEVNAQNSGCSYVYMVDAFRRINVTFEWSVRNATKITLMALGPEPENSKTVDPTGEQGTIPIDGINESADYVFTASNDNNQNASRCIRFTFPSVITIPAPTSLSFVHPPTVEPGATLTITWLQDDQYGIITHFVIERSPSNGDAYISRGTVLVDAVIPVWVNGEWVVKHYFEETLPSPPCNIKYQVTAYYIDQNGIEQHTLPSEEIFYYNCP
ncbi:MAG: FHA domain-containing protein [Anaerolineae bacterium]|nr:FHA domain-containing protein [Anaerolineae bacterium]